MRVGDIFQRICVQHDEVGFFAGGDHAHPSESENPGVHGRSRLNRLGCGEPAAGIVGDLLVRAEAIAGSVRTESDDHTGVVNFLHVAAVKFEELIGRVPGGLPGFELAAHIRNGRRGQRLGQAFDFFFGLAG